MRFIFGWKQYENYKKRTKSENVLEVRTKTVQNVAMMKF